MKNLKKILLTSAITATAVGGGVTALTKDFSNNLGNIDFNLPLSKGGAAIDLMSVGFEVNSSLVPNMVTFWHAWFWSDNMGRRTETETVIPGTSGYNAANFVKYSGYSNSGYVAVIKIEVNNLFYYLEFDAMSYLLSFTYNTTGDYPYFSAPHWSKGYAISQRRGTPVTSSPSINIYLNEDKTFLMIDLINTDPGMIGHRFSLPASL